MVMRKMPNVNPVGGTTNPKYNHRKAGLRPIYKGINKMYEKIVGDTRKLS